MSHNAGESLSFLWRQALVEVWFFPIQTFSQDAWLLLQFVCSLEIDQRVLSVSKVEGASLVYGREYWDRKSTYVRHTLCSLEIATGFPSPNSIPYPKEAPSPL